MDSWFVQCVDDNFVWGATIMDKINTETVMSLMDIVTIQLAFISNVDFKCDWATPHVRNGG
jgi:hypothetical protein